MSNTGRQLIVTQEAALFAFLSGFCTPDTSTFPKTQLRVSNALDRCFPAASWGSIRKPTTCCRARVRGQNYQKKEKNQTNKHNSDSLRGQSQTVFQWRALSHTIKPTNPDPAERHFVWQDAAGLQWCWAAPRREVSIRMGRKVQNKCSPATGRCFNPWRNKSELPRERFLMNPGSLFLHSTSQILRNEAGRREKQKKIGLSEKIKCTSHVSSSAMLPVIAWSCVWLHWHEQSNMIRCLITDD